ncbi:MAG TPA: Ig-like domain-containing protein [Armatimonadota bacterium]|nr:Ig-like domain-containing protein [Armatimonadota bacterium]
MKHWYRFLSVSVIALASLVFFAGCGGGDAATASTGKSLTFTFTWPSTSDGVVDLSAANSLGIVLHNEAGNVVGNGRIKRPLPGEPQSSLLSIVNLPSGRIIYTVTAYNTDDATGTQVASATGAKTLDSTTTSGTIALGTGAVNHIMFNNRAITINRNATYQLTVVAMTETHQILLLPTDVVFTFQSDQPGIASVSDHQGLVTGSTVGVANITATATLGGQQFETMNPAVISVQ